MSGPVILGIAPKPSAESSGPRIKGRKGRSIRIDGLTYILDFLPPVTLSNFTGAVFHACGRCFKTLGDDPFNGRPGVMRPGVPPDARCAFCGGRAERHEF